MYFAVRYRTVLGPFAGPRVVRCSYVVEIVHDVSFFPLVLTTCTASSFERSSSGSVLGGPLEKGISAHMGLDIAFVLFAARVSPASELAGFVAIKRL